MLIGEDQGDQEMPPCVTGFVYVRRRCQVFFLFASGFETGVEVVIILVLHVFTLQLCIFLRGTGAYFVFRRICIIRLLHALSLGPTTMIGIPAPIPRLCLSLEFDIERTAERPSAESHDAAIKEAARVVDGFINFSKFGVTPDAFSAKVIDGLKLIQIDCYHFQQHTMHRLTQTSTLLTVVQPFDTSSFMLGIILMIQLMRHQNYSFASLHPLVSRRKQLMVFLQPESD